MLTLEGRVTQYFGQKVKTLVVVIVLCRVQFFIVIILLTEIQVVIVGHEILNASRVLTMSERNIDINFRFNVEDRDNKKRFFPIARDNFYIGINVTATRQIGVVVIPCSPSNDWPKVPSLTFRGFCQAKYINSVPATLLR